MTYSKDKVAGLSVADAIGVICASATYASRWADFKGCIELSGEQIVSIGGDYMSRGIQVFSSEPEDLIFRRPEPEKTQLEMDKEAYAAALRPLVDDLAAGELVAICRAVDLGAASPSFKFPADGWDEHWKLIVDGKNAVLVDDKGAKYKLLSFQAAVGELPANSSTATVLGDEYNAAGFKSRLDGAQGALIGNSFAVVSAVPETNITKPGAAGPLQSEAPAALAELRKLGAGDPSKPKGKRGGGRQPKFIWIESLRALAAKIYADGIPKQGDGGQAGLEKFMQDWFAENGRPDHDGEPEIPCESLIREHVRQVIEAHAKAVHGGR